MGDSINVMSVYHPFPVRIDTAGAIGSGSNNCINLVKGSACPPGCISLNGTGKANDIGNCQPLNTNIQYDACFQVGEFPSHAIPGIVEAKAGNSIVVLVPLKADASATGDGAQFVNAFGSQIPNILGSQPDHLQGYPDVPASTGANWSLSAIVKTNRPFYTWITTYDSTLSPPQTRVVVMSEPVLIAQTDLANIQRLPITDPDDVIHEITAVSYRAAPPLVGCDPVAGPMNIYMEANGAEPGSSPSGSSSSGPSPELLGEIFGGIIGGIILLIAIYFGLRWAMSGTGDWFAGLGERIAGALRPARSALANTLGVGARSGRPLPRPEAASSNGTFTRVNPMNRGRPPPGSAAAIANRSSSGESLATQVAASGVGDLGQPRPNGSLTLRAPPPRSPAAVVNQLSRGSPDALRQAQRNIDSATRRTLGTSPAATRVQGLLDARRKERAERLAAANRGTGIVDRAGLERALARQRALGHTLDQPLPGSAAAIASRGSRGTASGVPPSASLTIRTPAPAPRRRIVAPSPPAETDEERIDRRAKETALPRSGPSAFLASEKARNPLIGKGRRRKNRRHLRTGRKV